MLWIYGFVNITFLMTKAEGDKNLSDNLEDGGQVTTVFFAQHLANTFSWNLFKYQIEEALLIEVFYDLNNVRVVQVFQYFHLLEGSNQVHLLTDGLYLANTFEA